jgi:hypothetical protein
MAPDVVALEGLLLDHESGHQSTYSPEELSVLTRSALSIFSGHAPIKLRL